MTKQPPSTDQKASPQKFIKLIPDFILSWGPLILYGILSFYSSFWVSNLVFAVAVVSVAAYGLYEKGRLPFMTYASSFLVGGFAFFSVITGNTDAFYLKSSLNFLLLSAVSFWSLYSGRSLAERALGVFLTLPQSSWEKTTRDFTLFFFMLFCLNSLIWDKLPSSPFYLSRFFLFSLFILGFVLFEAYRLWNEKKLFKEQLFMRDHKG